LSIYFIFDNYIIKYEKFIFWPEIYVGFLRWKGWGKSKKRL
jgi:hypothetical protein